jgi:hypothetical protein
MNRRTAVLCLLAIAFLAPLLARAEHTRYWLQSDFSDFEKGTAKGVAIRSDGTLIPAPRFEPFSDPNLAYLWALRLDSRGRLFAAGGSDAKVLRFDDSGKPTTVFESSELAAQDIAFDAKDNLYVATSPDGKVYKVTPDGQKSVFFDPKTKYIWALAFDPQGVLFVATGDTGEVFAVTPEGKGGLFYQSEERHARSLAFDAKGNLLIGTEPDGLILRVEIVRKDAHAVPQAGASFVIYETSKSEVTSLLEDSSGNLYASAVAEKTHVPAAPVVPALAPQLPQVGAAGVAPQGIVLQETQTLSAQAAAPRPFIPIPSGGGAEIVKIAPDGAPETIWTSHEDLVFATAFSAAGKLLLGTGNDGEIIEIVGNGIFSSISWWGENGGAQGKAELYVRSGNTSNPGKNWSDWAGPYKEAKGEAVSSPAARFAQWKAVFLASDSGGTPSISWVSLAYLPKNVAPVIDDIAVQDPGIRVSGFAPQPGAPGAPVPAQLRMPHSAGANPSPLAANAEASVKPGHVEVPPQGFEDKGYQSVLWSAHDDNDDDLIYSIYYRGEGEQNWRLLKDNLKERYYSWNTATMPDGAYVLKIVASDSPSNPPGQALSAERESGRFEIANTPPRIENLHADVSGSDATVSLDAIASSSSVARARYSLDAGDWQIVFPEGQLSDAPRESYRIRLAGLSPGEHTISVQIADRFDNTTAAKTTFTIPAPASK